MKKQGFIYVFLLLYVTAMLRPITPFIEYYINYDYIAEKLCENKNKPILVCNGKCYLNKEVSKIYVDPVEDNKPTTPSLRVELEKYPITTLQKDTFEFYSLKKGKNKILLHTYLSEQEYLFKVFHPPNC